jgi:hypothetical protein
LKYRAGSGIEILSAIPATVSVIFTGIHLGKGIERANNIAVPPQPF